MKPQSTEPLWDSLSGDLFRRGYSFGLSACQLAQVAKAVALARNETDWEKSVINGAHSPAIWFLAGFAFELFLKSAIAAKGGDTTEIKLLGHDLVAALENAEERGVSFSETTRFSVEVVNRTHNNRGGNGLYFRYGGASGAEVVTHDAMISSLEELLQQTAQLLDQPNATFDNFLVPFEPTDPEPDGEV